MIVGDPKEWAAHFRSVDSRFLQHLLALWPKCLSTLPAQPNEDTITINLIAVLLKDGEVRRLVHWIDYQYEPFGYTPEGLAFSKGKIDMGVILENGEDRSLYLAYECKRLNVLYGGSKHSLATRYVADGLMRFVTEQYAEGLPVGCMLGYVLDGDCAAAITSVQTAIHANANAQLVAGPDADNSLDILQRFSTRHLKQTDKTEIEVRHAFLPF